MAFLMFLPDAICGRRTPFASYLVFEEIIDIHHLAFHLTQVVHCFALLMEYPSHQTCHIFQINLGLSQCVPHFYLATHHVRLLVLLCHIHHHFVDYVRYH